MKRTPLSKILEEVRSLARSEQVQLRGVLDALLAEPEPSSGTVRPSISQQSEPSI